MKKGLGYHVPKEDLEIGPARFFQLYGYKLLTAFGWELSTLISYERYMNVLEPYFESTILDAERDDYNDALTKMNESRSRHYAESTLNSFRSAINDICYFAEVYSDGIYKNNLWGAGWTPSNIKETKGKRLPRSLSVVQEIQIYQKMQENYLHDSLYLCVAIMFYMGLRPAECYALEFGDVRTLEGHENVKCLYVYKQVRNRLEHTNNLKTPNAYRVLPIPEELAEWLEERKNEVKKRIPSTEDVNTYPIICRNETSSGLAVHCQARKFEKLCRELLREQAFSSDALNLMSKEVYSGGRGEESSGTSYLFRRNFATAVIGVCGMEVDEVQYYMGHQFRDEDERRRDFLNPDILYRMWKKINLRGFSKRAEYWFKLNKKELLITQRHAVIEVTKEYLDAHPGGIDIQIWNEFPNDYIQFNMSTKVTHGPTIDCRFEPMKLQPAERVNIAEDVSEAISKAKAKMLSKATKGASA